MSTALWYVLLGSSHWSTHSTLSSTTQTSRHTTTHWTAPWVGGSTARPSPPTAGPVGKGQEVSLTTEESCRGGRWEGGGTANLVRLHNHVFMLQHPMSHTQILSTGVMYCSTFRLFGRSTIGTWLHTYKCVHAYVGNVADGGGGEVGNNIKCNIAIPEYSVFKKLGMEKTLTTPGSHTHPSTYNVYKSLTVSPLAALQPAPL